MVLVVIIGSVDIVLFLFEEELLFIVIVEGLFLVIWKYDVFKGGVLLLVNDFVDLKRKN